MGATINGIASAIGVDDKLVITAAANQRVSTGTTIKDLIIDVTRNLVITSTTLNVKSIDLIDRDTLTRRVINNIIPIRQRLILVKCVGYLANIAGIILVRIKPDRPPIKAGRRGLYIIPVATIKGDV